MAKFRLETRGRNPTQSGARAAGIVERLQIGKHIALRRGPGGILPQVNPLTLKTAEEVFGNGVIVGITSAGHALADTIGHQPFPTGPGRILHTPVTVEDKPFWRLAAAVCHFQGRKRQLRVDPPRDLKQALRMRTPQSSWYTGLLRLPDKASLRFSQL